MPLTWSIPCYGDGTATSTRVGRGERSALRGHVVHGPLAAVAILALRELHLVARTPIWLIPLILVGGQLLTTAAGLWWDRSRGRIQLHALIAMQ